jgi:hypothetical protein
MASGCRAGPDPPRDLTARRRNPQASRNQLHRCRTDHPVALRDRAGSERPHFYLPGWVPTLSRNHGSAAGAAGWGAAAASRESAVRCLAVTVW